MTEGKVWLLYLTLQFEKVVIAGVFNDVGVLFAHAQKLKNGKLRALGGGKDRIDLWSDGNTYEGYCERRTLNEISPLFAPKEGS